MNDDKRRQHRQTDRQADRQKNISITIINKIKSIGRSSACDTFSLNSGRIS